MLRTVFLILSIFMSTMVPVFSESWAACDLNTSTDLTQYLKDCATGVDGAVSPDAAGSDVSGVKKLVTDVAKEVIAFGALFAIGAIVFAGIRYTISAGDDEKIKHAKNTAVYAGIGLLLLTLAFPLVDTIVGIFYR